MPSKDHAPSQADKFRDLAAQHECDEDDAAFEDKMGKMAAPLKPEEKPA